MSSHAVARLESELADVAGAPVELERPSDPAHGDYATNVALRLAPVRKQAPRELASQLAKAAATSPRVEKAEVAGPGFLNLWVARQWYRDALAEILGAGGEYGGGSAVPRERVQVELVSANPTGPLTVGHGRNGAYGDSVARLLEFAGHHVEREYYFNDIGRQVDLFRESVAARTRGDAAPEDGYTGDYVAEIAARGGDPVDAMFDDIKRDLVAFRIRIDTWAHQATIEAEIDAIVQRLDTYSAEGALWARTSAYGDDKDRVLVRSDETPTYFAADAAYLHYKVERALSRFIYVLGADHHGYVARLKALAQMLGRDPDCVEVLIYQLVHILEGGEAKRVSRRRGDVVFLRELMDKIGVDAARWYLVSRSHDQTIEIDIDLAREKSEKNPVYYVQYAHARIAGIVRNAATVEPSPEPPEELAREERDLVKRLAEFPTVVSEATVRRGPHAIPNYAIRLADDFHRFYHHHRVLDGDAPRFRLALCIATQNVIARALDLIGVEAPARM